MSVLKVGALRSPSASSNNIVLNSDGTITTGDGGTFVSNNYYEAFKLEGPTITSIHPSTNLNRGDTVYIDGSGFDSSANIIFVSNTNVDTILGKQFIAVNSSSNITFTVPDYLGSLTYADSPYDLRLTIQNTGLADFEADAVDMSDFVNGYGQVRGYLTGGSGDPGKTDIQRYPFATDSDASDAGDLTIGRGYAAGQSSSVSGYTSGGTRNIPGGGSTTYNIIDKFPFATDSNATDVGDLSANQRRSAGSSSTTNGYAVANNRVNKFPFATDTNATDVADQSVSRDQLAGQSSSTHGYNSGGSGGNVIDKFPFATDANSTDVGDLTVSRSYVHGQSSSASGYSSAGSPDINVIDKFPFATDSNATDVGDLVTGKTGQSGQSSYQNGYTTGGSNLSGDNTMQKFPFATDSNASNIGTLNLSVNGPTSGIQY